MQATKFQTVEYGQIIGGIEVFPEFISPQIALKIGNLANDFFSTYPEEPFANIRSSLIGSICIHSEKPDEVAETPDEFDYSPIDKDYFEDPLISHLKNIIPVIDSTTNQTETSLIHRYRKHAQLPLHKDGASRIRAISLMGKGELIIPDEKPVLLEPGTMFRASSDALHGVKNISDIRYSLALIDKDKSDK